DPEIRVQAGAGARRRGRLDDSRRLLEELVRSDPGNAAAQYELGLTFRQLRDTARASAAFQAAVAADPWLDGAWNGLAQLASEARGADAALPYLARFEETHQASEQQRAIELDLASAPGDPVLVTELGRHHARHGHVDRAEPLFA